MILIRILIIALLLVGCNSIRYKDDLQFLVSAQANSPEFPVYINTKLCKDMDGEMGACFKRVRSNESILITLEKRPYRMRVNLQCSKDTGINFSKDVLENDQFSYEIKPDSFSMIKSFTCLGEIYPDDRKEPVSAIFEIRFTVIDADYVKREIMEVYRYKGKDYLLLGQHAKFAKVWDVDDDDQIKEKTYRKDAIIRINDPKRVKAISESFNMRFNKIGF